MIRRIARTGVDDSCRDCSIHSRSLCALSLQSVARSSQLSSWPMQDMPLSLIVKRVMVFPRSIS